MYFDVHTFNTIMYITSPWMSDVKGKVQILSEYWVVFILRTKQSSAWSSGLCIHHVNTLQPPLSQPAGNCVYDILSLSQSNCGKRWKSPWWDRTHNGGHVEPICSRLYDLLSRLKCHRAIIHWKLFGNSDCKNINGYSLTTLHEDLAREVPCHAGSYVTVRLRMASLMQYRLRVLYPFHRCSPLWISSWLLISQSEL